MNFLLQILNKNVSEAILYYNTNDGLAYENYIMSYQVHNLQINRNKNPYFSYFASNFYSFIRLYSKLAV